MDYEARGEDELAFKSRDEILLFCKYDQNYYYGHHPNTGNFGYVYHLDVEIPGLFYQLSSFLTLMKDWLDKLEPVQYTQIPSVPEAPKPDVLPKKKRLQRDGICFAKCKTRNESIHRFEEQ